MVIKRLKLKNNLIGFLMLPIILSYKVALSPLGKQCYYRWGSCDVSLSEPLSENEYLWMRVSPIIMINMLLMLALLLSAR